MLRRLLWIGVALTIAALGIAALGSAVAQPITGTQAGRAIGAANLFSGQIRDYHRGPRAWTGLTAPPPGYCRIMAGGEFALKELARLASKALLFRQSELALRLERAGDHLSDELDAEEAINDEAGITYDVYPCPARTSAYVGRAKVLKPIVARMVLCRERADVLRVSFAARRSVVQHCLHLPGRQFTTSIP